jgi:hypothetical protein
VAPGRDEVCDGVDNDCDGTVDDGDGDGDGSPACSDCDDADPGAAPGLEEVCDGVDNDCDGTVDDGAPCGATGTCTDGVCRWVFEAATTDVEHDCGEAVNARWCSGSCASGEVMVGAPRRGTAELPMGTYTAVVRARTAGITDHVPDCGPVFRIRVTDLDGDGSGSCLDCYFGGDRSVRPTSGDFPTLGDWYDFDIPFSIGPERFGHRVQVLVLRWRCTTVELCVRRVEILGE